MANQTYGVAAGLVTMLRKHGMKIATVESCTGGLLSKMITDVPGASEVFDVGITTYSNEMKTRLVGVSEDILSQYGAVSWQTAQAMATGIRELSGADFGISTTGIAGPGGGTEEKPVGLVYIGIAAPDKTAVIKWIAPGETPTREYVRQNAAENALAMVASYLMLVDDGTIRKE